MTQHLFLLSQTILFAARVNEPGGITYPTSEVAYDTVTTGAFGDIPIGATVLFGSTAGADDLGRKRIRAAADATTLYIGRGSRGKRDGEFNISDNDYITVIDTRSVWSKIPNITSGTIVKDETAYTDQTSQIPPKANITGGWRAATIDSGTGLATFQFVGSGSVPVAPGATLTTYTYDVGDGTITAGAGTNTITATFPAGSRWVKLTVTDSNGKTNFMEVLVYAHDPDDSECVAAQCTNHRITQRGQECSFLILEDIPISTYPDGMPVIFWEGEPASSSDYSNVLFWGWHQTDDNSVRADRTATLKDTTLHCLDLAGRLDTLPGFPQSLTRDATPASWLEMAGLTMPLYIYYLLAFHSTAFELGYFTCAATGYPMPIISSDGESLFSQAAKMAEAMIPDFILTCDRNGALRVLPDPQLQNTADRTATSQATIDGSNILAISWQRQRPPRYHWNWTYAIASHETAIDYFACRAPGEAPGQGLSSNEVNYKLALSQDDLNDCEGHRYGYINSFNGQIVVTMASDLGIEPADMTWATLTLASSYHRRQMGFTAARCLPIEVGISYEYRPTGTVRTVDLILEEETSGTPAVTYVPPVTDWPWEPPPPIETPPPPTGSGDGLGRFMFAIDDYIVYTASLRAASPTWIDVTGAVTGTIYDAILSPQDDVDTAYATSSTGFWKTTDLSSGSPTWTQIRSTAQLNTGYGSSAIFPAYKISASINVPGFVAFWHGVTVSTEYMACTITPDGGSSWTYNRLWTGAGPTLDTGSALGADDYLPHLVGGEVVLGAVFERQSGRIYFYQSVDSGATWSGAELFDNGSASTNQCLTLHYPYNNNPTGQIIYFCMAGGGGAGLHGLYRSTNSGATWTRINTGETGAKRHGAETHTLNSQRLFHWREDNTLWLSTDGGNNWTQAAAAGISGTVRAAGGFPYNNQLYYVLTTAGLFVSVTNGASFMDKSGDWANGFTCSPGGGALAATWTE